MNTQTLLTGWGFMRLFRLAMGMIMAIQAFQTHDSAIGFISAFFLFQAITNTGCCGSAGCAVPVTNKKTDNAEDISFEEIRSEEK